MLVYFHKFGVALNSATSKCACRFELASLTHTLLLNKTFLLAQTYLPHLFSFASCGNGNIKGCLKYMKQVLGSLPTCCLFWFIQEQGKVSMLVKFCHISCGSVACKV